MTHEEYFKLYGKWQYYPGASALWKTEGRAPTEEERYQAFKSRMLAELQAQNVTDWGLGK